MDLSWLGNLFGSFLDIFKPLAQITHWQIWSAIWDLINRLRSWYKWYQTNVQANMKRMRALYDHYFNTFVAPILKIVDTIRRMTAIVGLVNRKLASQLNIMFERVEGYILLPFNTVIQHINKMQQMFGAFLTPLGYLDRATLLNSFWRDAGLLWNLLQNPLGSATAVSPPPNLADFEKTFAPLQQYVQGQASPIQPDVDAGVTNILTYMGAQVTNG
ncbi:MAG: hypothetical protein ACRD4R_13005 [Candidatus Acidiferrales bacterium]